MSRHAPSRHTAAEPRTHDAVVGRRARLGAVIGLVVGLAVAALSATDVAASWTDRVLGGSAFSTTPFGFESATLGAPFATHSEAAPAVLSLLPAAPLLPGQSVYGAISLRSVAGSPAVAVTVDGTASVPSGLASLLQYAVVRSPTCDSTSFGSTASFVVGSVTGGVPLSADSASGAVVLPAGSPTTTGTVVPLCFRMTLPDTLAVWTAGAASSTLRATWTFLGTA